jgi:phosphoribosylformylglycinamidine synthase
MAMASGLGARLVAAPEGVPAAAFWFGEDQARYVVTVRAGDVEAVTTQARAAGVLLRLLGHTDGATLSIPGEKPMLVAALRERFESWLPGYMSRTDP